MPPVRVVFVIALGLTAAAARAEDATLAEARDRPVEIDWTTTGEGEPCPKQEGSEAQVVSLAGSAAEGAAPSHFSVHMEALADGRYALRVGRPGDEARTRTLPSCAEAREAAILIMATAVGGESAAPPPTEDAPPAGASIRAQMGVPRRFTLTLVALLDHGTLPGVGAGPALDAGYARGLLRVGVAARYLPARAAPGVPRGAAMRVDSFAVGLHAGALFRFARTAFGPRAELELGSLRGRARGVEESVTRSTFWAALLGGAELELWLHSRVAASLLVLAGPSLRRPVFALADNGARYTTAPLVLRAGLGITLRIDGLFARETARTDPKD